MLPRTHRAGKEYFAKAKSPGRRFSTPHFSTLTTPSGKEKKFSVVISGKVARSAVARNKLRRRVYGVIRDEIPRMRGGVVMIVYARTGAAGLPYRTIHEEIVRLLHTSGAIKPL